MNHEHNFQHLPKRQLPDEVAAGILNFLQEYTNEFENRYGHQIQRYYDQLYHRGQSSLFDEVGESF